MTPIPCSSVKGRITRSMSRSIREYRGWSVSTGAICSIRRSCSASSSTVEYATTRHGSRLAVATEMLAAQQVFDSGGQTWGVHILAFGREVA